MKKVSPTAGNRLDHPEGNRIRLTEQGMRYGNLAFEEFL